MSFHELFILEEHVQYFRKRAREFEILKYSYYFKTTNTCKGLLAIVFLKAIT